MPDLHNLISLLQNSQKTFLILCGFPYAGKSHIAKQLIEKTDVVFVSIDAIFLAHGFDWSSGKLPDVEEWVQIFNQSYEETRRGLNDGKNILYDSTNQTIASRDRLREVANSVGADARVIFVKTAIETVWQRWKENQENPSRPQVSKELVQMTIDMFEEPTVNESVIAFDN